ncbi:MAG: hypothetical protein ACYSSI_07560 [Planctomycetota bacterium]|jgi:hypothetical protein
MIKFLWELTEFLTGFSQGCTGVALVLPGSPKKSLGGDVKHLPGAIS